MTTIEWSGEGTHDWVMDHSTAQMPAFLTLLALAWRSNNHGVATFVDWQDLAWTARISDRTAKRHIQSLVEGSHITETAPMTWQIETGK